MWGGSGLLLGNSSALSGGMSHNGLSSGDIHSHSGSLAPAVYSTAISASSKNRHLAMLMRTPMYFREIAWGEACFRSCCVARILIALEKTSVLKERSYLPIYSFEVWRKKTLDLLTNAWYRDNLVRYKSKDPSIALHELRRAAPVDINSQHGASVLSNLSAILGGVTIPKEELDKVKQKTWQKQAQFVCQQLEASVENNIWGLFYTPVRFHYSKNDALYKEYEEAIRPNKPMDFKTVTTKLKLDWSENGFKDLQEVERTIKIIWENCERFHGDRKNAQILEALDTIRRTFNQIWDLVFQRKRHAKATLVD